MSRDWTPREYFWADVWLQKNDKSLRGQPLIFTETTTGETIRLDNHLAYDRYPELSFLLDEFDKLYQLYENSPAALECLDKIEEYLKIVEDEEINGETPFTNKDFETVKKWFEGTLDANFYFGEYNNLCFKEWVIKYIEIQTQNRDKSEMER